MDVEKRLKRAVEHAAPNVKESVLQKCNNISESKEKTVFLKTSASHKRERFYRFIAVAALFLLMLNVSIELLQGHAKKRVDTIVDIDVNPSIELSINADDEIVSVRAINEDAIEILDGMKLEGTQTKVAVNAIIGSMFEHGYLQGETDSILVSVENKDSEKSEAIQASITEDINTLLKAYNKDVYIIGQSVCQDEEIVNMALTYGISEGKAELIRKVLQMSDVYTIENLVYLNITELNEIICGLNEIGSSEINNDPDEPEPEVQEPDSEAGTEPDPMGPEHNVEELEATVSENSVSENSISENSVSANEIDPEIGDPAAVVNNQTESMDTQSDTEKDNNTNNSSSEEKED